MKYNFFDGVMYTIDEILNQFPNFYGTSYEEMYNLFSKDNTPALQEVQDKLKEKEIKYNEDYLLINYYYLKNRIETLQIRGLVYLKLLNYLRKLNHSEEDKNEDLEMQLSKENIFHFKGIVCGKDLKQILNCLNEVTKEIEVTIKRMQNTDTYLAPISIVSRNNEEWLLYPKKEKSNQKLKKNHYSRRLELKYN